MIQLASEDFDMRYDDLGRGIPALLLPATLWGNSETKCVLTKNIAQSTTYGVAQKLDVNKTSKHEETK